MKYLFIAIFTVIVTSLLSQFTKRQKPMALTADAGRLTPEKMSACVTVIVGVIMAVSGLGSAIVTLTSGEGLGGLWWSILLFVLGSAIAGFMYPSLFSAHDVIWDAEGVEGASSTFGPTLGRKRHKIKWENIVHRGITITQYWYLETHDKKRIYWSYLYSGYGEFDKVLAEKCDKLNAP